MAKMKRGWMKIYELYGVQESGVVIGLLWQGTALGAFTAFFMCYFTPCTRLLASSLTFFPFQMWAFCLGLGLGILGLLAFGFLLSAANIFYTNVIVCPKIASRMVGAVGEWAGVETVLDVGCGRGLLLNTVALRLKKEGIGGRVVGVDLWLDAKESGKSMSATLKTASMEGTQEYVTCKTGDPRNLPFTDAYFDLVVSALCLSTVGEEFGRTSAIAAAQRSNCLQEIVRVLKPGGQAIIWDLFYAKDYFKKLQEMGMEMVSLSETIPAYMVQSNIISFVKPRSP